MESFSFWFRKRRGRQANGQRGIQGTPQKKTLPTVAPQPTTAIFLSLQFGPLMELNSISKNFDLNRNEKLGYGRYQNQNKSIHSSTHP